MMADEAFSVVLQSAKYAAEAIREGASWIQMTSSTISI